MYENVSYRLFRESLKILNRVLKAPFEDVSLDTHVPNYGTPFGKTATFLHILSIK
jgi:hypothetical protein